MARGRDDALSRHVAAIERALGRVEACVSRIRAGLARDVASGAFRSMGFASAAAFVDHVVPPSTLAAVLLGAHGDAIADPPKAGRVSVIDAEEGGDPGPASSAGVRRLVATIERQRRAERELRDAVLDMRRSLEEIERSSLHVHGGFATFEELLACVLGPRPLLSSLLLFVDPPSAMRGRPSSFLPVADDELLSDAPEVPRVEELAGETMLGLPEDPASPALTSTSTETALAGLLTFDPPPAAEPTPPKSAPPPSARGPKTRISVVTATIVVAAAVGAALGFRTAPVAHAAPEASSAASASSSATQSLPGPPPR